MERCQRDRLSSFAKTVGPEKSRGFESHPLLQFFLKHSIFWTIRIGQLIERLYHEARIPCETEKSIIVVDVTGTLATRKQ